MPLIVTPHQLNQRAELYHQLGSLLAAGIPLPKALETMRRSPPDRSFRAPLRALSHWLQQGHTFSDALDMEPGWIPAFDRALLQAGEKSGRLDATFRLLADYYRDRAQLFRKMLGPSIYPLLVLHMAVVIFPTQMLVNLVWKGEVMAFLIQKAFILLPLYGVALLAMYASQGRRGERWRAIFEAIIHAIPILGTARRNLALSRLAAALDALLNAGVNIVQSWELAAAASGSPALRRAVRGFREKVEAGETPGEAISQCPQFPELFSNLYYSGEISGQVDESLRRLETHYRQEGERKLAMVAEWAPRLLYLAVVLGIAFQIVSFYAGYFQQIGDVLNF